MICIRLSAALTHVQLNASPGFHLSLGLSSTLVHLSQILGVTSPFPQPPYPIFDLVLLTQSSKYFSYLTFTILVQILILIFLSFDILFLRGGGMNQSDRVKPQ